MKKHILLLALLLTVFAGKSATYYWVSGTGNWSDLTHWATTSGGNTFYASVPGNSDDVVFDANSFTTTNQSVTINVSANMKSLSFTGIPTGTSIYGSITVYGSVTLHSNLSSGLYIALKGTGTHTFTSAGQTIGNIIQSGSGSYTLQDPLKVSSSIDIQDGSFYASGYNIDCGTFGSTTTNTRTIDISNITITLRSGWGATSLFYLQNLTLNSSGCQFEVLDSHVLYFYGNYPISIKGAHFYYATATANGLVQFRAENCTATGSIILDGLGTVICTKGTLHLVEFKKSCSFWVQKVTVDSLLFSGTGGGYAMDLSIGSNDTLTISGAWISQPGLCANSNTYTQTGGKILKSSGSVTLDYVKMYSMKAIGGATFTANNVLYDNGANSGWTINTLPPTKYYWVGGTGNWSDPTHWAFTSGGAGQASTGCIPTRYDSVYFDANSFSAGGQTVTVDVTAECANMDWRGVTNTPTFYKPNNCASVFVYGSLFFDVNMVFNMTFNYYCSGNSTAWRMLGGTGTHTINLNGLQVNIDWFEIYSTGTYVLASDFTGGSTFFRMVKGSFLSNNYTITCGYFDLRCVNGTTADLGTSKVYCDYATLGSNYASSTFNTSNAEFVVKTNLDFAQSGISVKSVLFTGDFASLYAYNTTCQRVEYQRWGFINFYGGGGLTAHVVLADSGLSINCPLTVDSLIFANTSGGNSYGIGNGYSITINSAWVIGDGTCARPNQFYGSYYGISNVSVPSGAVNINYGKLYYNVAAAGGATFNANNIVFDGGGWTGWNITTTPSQNYYWVGGTGQWDDPTHWALSYGGAPQSATGCIPTQNDSVFFTDLSFTAFNDMVNPPSVAYFSPECKYLSFNGTLNSPIFNPGNLYIYGSLHLEPGITNYAAFNFNGAGSGNTIDMAGVDAQRMQFNGPGDYTVTDSLWITGTVYIAGGSFTYMHNTLGAGSFSIQTNGIYPTDITMDAPLITILNDGGQFFYYDNLVNSFTVNTIDVYFANQNGYASGSFYSQASTTIPPYGIIWSDTVYSLSVYASGGHMTRAESEYNLYLTSDGNVTIDNIVCRNGNAYIYSNNGMLTCDSLLILGEGQQFYHYLYGQITVNDSFFVASNGCFKNFLDGQKNTWLYMPAGKVVAVDFLYISGIDASGVSAFYGGVNSVDNGGNTNIDFSTGTTYTTSLNSTTFCTVNNTYIIRINGNPYRRSQRWEEVGTGTILGYADSLIVTPTSFPAQYYFYASYGTNCDQPDLITLDLGAWISGGDAYFTNNNDSDWYNCVNWSNGQFPDSTSNAHISAFSYARIRDNEEAYCKDLYIEKGATLQILGGKLYVYGDIYNEGSLDHVSDSLVLTGGGNTVFYTYPTTIEGLYITKRNGATVSYNGTYSTIKGSFNPLDGIVYPDPGMPLVIANDATSLTGSPISYVEGAVTKEGNDAFTFPVGQNGRWQPIGISAPASSGNAFTAQYYATGYPDTTTNGTVGWVSKYEYWTLDHTQGSDGVSVRLYWNDSAFSKVYFTGSTDLTVAHYNGTDWEDVGYSQATAPGLSGYVESVVTTNFSPFTFASPNFTNPLPVTWISANAWRSGNDITVTWNLAAELNTSHFVLETSIDGQHWTYLGQLKAAGFSTTPTSYSYQHVQAGAAARTYRIWAVDYNGAKMRSPLAQAPALDADGLTPVQLFPNPLLKGNLLQITGVTAGTSYTVWNAQGALLMSGQFQQEQPNLSLSHFSPGIYTIQFNDHGKLTVKRLVIE